MAIYNAGAGGGGSGVKLAFLSTDKDSISLTSSKTSDTFTITYDGDGVLSVKSSDTSIATVELVSGTTYRVNGVDDGEATLTVSATIGAKTVPYNEVEISVSCNLTSNILNDNSWAIISVKSQAGTASNYWSVGDTKAITLNGTVGTLTLSNVTLYVYILGFNHNSSIEGTGISFGTFKTALTGGTDVALVDSYYNLNTSYDGTKYFQINHWGTSSSPYNTNYGGWSACDMRYDILGSTDVAPTSYGSIKTTDATGTNPTSTCAINPPLNTTLMASLPIELRRVMKPITKYTNNKGDSGDLPASVTITTDYLPLLAEYEVQGSRKYANSNEQNYQAQYQYYQNGNSNIKYKHNDTLASCAWWVRSAFYNDAVRVCGIKFDSTTSGYRSSYSFGVAPVFLV